MTGSVAHYAADDVEARVLAALRVAGLDPDERLSPVQLAALDHFHTGGFRASLALKDLARIRSEDRVLDIGAGLAGRPGCWRLLRAAGSTVSTCLATTASRRCC
jgi:hypothetical protein